MMAFEQLEPFGSLAEEFRIGQLCAVVANVNSSSETRSQPFTAADFMPALAEERERIKAAQYAEETPEQTMARLDATLFGGRRG